MTTDSGQDKALAQWASADDRLIGNSLIESVPILNTLGIRLLKVTPSQTTISLTINESNVGPYGSVLGVALIAAADMAACVAAASAWRHGGDEKIGGFATQDFSSSFCRAARVGPVLIKAETQHCSQRRAVVAFTAHDQGQEDAIVLTGVVTVARLGNNPKNG